ncbi:MAG: aminofutalosine synthase MqnE [Pirellulales bacterium]|nr:aminofutalosine synthase MqnE [Pirellulales bacterium]
MTTSPRTAELERIRRKVEAAERLSAGEGTLLFEPEVDLHAVGQLADEVRRRKNGDVVYYNVNAHLNPTNACVYRCRLCAYSCDADSPEAYVLDDEAMLARAREATEAGATELHLVGGLHPERDYDWYLGIVRMLHEAYPALHLKAFSAVEIARFAELSGKPIEAVLEELHKAGLGSLPGGGAEIFDPAVREKICPRKADADTWLDVHRTAHRLGIRSNATMLFGHVETAAQRIDHLIRLRDLQDETGGFQAFVPLSFHPQGTALSDLPRASAFDALRTVAVSRLMLDNVDHIKAYWISLGIGTAQTALAYGADDLDGTVRHEEIHHRAGADSPEILSVAQLRRLIREAGRQPLERASLYRPVETQNNSE